MPPRLAAAPRLAALFVVWLAACVSYVSAADNKAANKKPAAPGLGDPGRLTAIQIETGRLKDGVVTIAGRDAVQQLVVTGGYSTGQTRDWTQKVTHEASPAGIVRVDATGLID